MAIMFMWLGLIASIGTFFLFCEGCFLAFCWCFGVVDNYLQDRHFKKISRNWRKIDTKEVLKLFSETEEMAA